MNFVLRCWSVSGHAHHAVRHVWHVVRHAPRAVYHVAAIGSTLVCVAIPIARLAVPPKAPIPPRFIERPAISAPRPGPTFVPGQFYYPPARPIVEKDVAPRFIPDDRPTAPNAIDEPVIAFGWLVGLVITFHERRRK